MVLSVEASGTPPLNYQWRYQASTFQTRSSHFRSTAFSWLMQARIRSWSATPQNPVKSFQPCWGGDRACRTSRITSVQLSDGGLLIQWEARKRSSGKGDWKMPSGATFPGVKVRVNRTGPAGNATFYRLLDR